MKLTWIVRLLRTILMRPNAMRHVVSLCVSVSQGMSRDARGCVWGGVAASAAGRGAANSRVAPAALLLLLNRS